MKKGLNAAAFSEARWSAPGRGAAYVKASRNRKASEVGAG